MSKMKKAPHERTLEADIPELIPYLSTGINVLDVGCGLGSITLNVAEIVKPGKVVGVEPVKDHVDTAQAWADSNPQLSNICFQVGDSHRLEFPDGTFDLVYSHTVMHFCLDPVLSMKEQKRVARKGGWVVASGVRDMPTTYPYSPHWEKVYEAWRRFFEIRLNDYRASGQDPITYFNEQNTKKPSYIMYGDLHAGRKCMQWFNQAGLTNVEIRIQPRRVKYRGHKDMHPWGGDFLALERREAFLPERERKQNLELDERMKQDHQRMIDAGLLDEETLERAKAEAQVFYDDPDAFQFWLEVFVIGRV
jgi:ubiquinone/menaquinone biosynthesis C-methylase UbiE